ncbi:ATP-dependent DNA helicase PIF1 [Ceratobasidium sp. AG-Ba]|nr:ATP-dependent DNA helicase PIF1 [Ceratobasidium sp. AG-Ba]
MKRADFDNASAMFSTLTLADLSRAADESARGQVPSNQIVALLRRMVHSAGGKVMGSDASRATYRSQIASTSLSLNPPSLWMTINPTDIHDPIMQVFAGENIDMDRFNATLGPDAQRRAENLAANPYAAARFFNYLIKTMFETLFGIRVAENRVESTLGVLGYVSGYYGVVEAQGRGSLHLHALLWLVDTPSSEDLQELLTSTEFRDRLAQYVDFIIHAHLDELTEESLRNRPHEPELAWSRPPDPSSQTYEADLREMETRLARSQQLHKCKRNTCLTIFDPKTRSWTCKRKAPFPLCDSTIVSENGTIQPKRTQGYLNNWNPSVLVYGRCNNDLKFFSNGAEARRARWYITGYATKGQRRTNNLSALLAKGLVHHFNEDDTIKGMRDRNGLLVFRALHAINRQQEQSGQQVLNLLMGYGDNVRSHSYTPLYLSAITSELRRAFQDFSKKTQHGLGITDIGGLSASANDSEATNDTVTIDVASSGYLIYRSQLCDYIMRGSELEDHSFFSFIANTYEAAITPKDSEVDVRENLSVPTNPQRGRPRHARSRYLPDHPKSTTQLRVIRPPGHNTLPNIIGPWIPRNDRPESYDLYCATILTLLKPWRNLKDLHIEQRPWPSLFDEFMQAASKRDKDFVSAAQYYYQCKDAADQDENECKAGLPEDSESWEDNDESGGFLDTLDSITFCPTDEQILAFQRSCVRWGDLQYAEHAVALGRASGILPKSEISTWPVCVPPPHLATKEDEARFSGWQKSMATDARSHKERPVGEVSTRILDLGSVQVAEGSRLSQNTVGSIKHAPDVEEWIEPLDVARLKSDQRRAYDIVATHLDDRLANRNPKQLLMLIHGEGGTGKSMVLSCLTELFNRRKVPGMLLKGAPTGIAASVIDGSTIHTLCHLSVNDKQKFGDKTLQCLRQTWNGVEYFVIDELSMMSRGFFTRVSAALAAAKNVESADSTFLAFGGLNMVVCGDFGQFEPVARGPQSSLYWAMESGDSEDNKQGRLLYETLTTVVLLKEQCRTRDEVWLRILRNIRQGACTPDDIQEIRSLIVGFEDSDAGPEEEEETWHDAVLVTPRNICRIDWNRAANRMHAMRSGCQLFICPAEDTVEGRPITSQERWDAVQSKGPRSKDRFGCNGLPDRVELAVGMKVMVTVNVETELDIANGSRGVVVDLILDHREGQEAAAEVSEVHLKYPPACVLVQLDRTKAAKIDGLGERVIPIFPRVRRFDIPQKKGKVLHAKRRQIPITSAYAFTDYRSQGQTISKVIVDIANPPPPGRMTLSSIYVSFSRSFGRKTIRLLRDFDESVLTQRPPDALLREYARLEQLNEETKRHWEDEKRARERTTVR